MNQPEYDKQIARDLQTQLQASGLEPLPLGGRMLLPVVQGGMGAGVSAHRLAGSVAALGAMGTISSVDLRRHHPDLMQQTRDLLAINVMRAVSAYGPSVTRALECGIDAVVVGAGLPLDLPELAQDHPNALLLPILSDARGVQLLVRTRERKKRVVHVKPRCTLAFDCLARCGLRDGLPGWGQFCIDTQLAAALRGGPKKGLYFRGVGALPFGDGIRSVRALMQRLLTPHAAAAA